ncbi:MAG TPA: PAS domain S-box protein [Longimicrobium sp.]
MALALTVGALALTVGALALTLAVRPIVDRNMIGLLLGAITLSAWYGGLRAGLSAVSFSVAGGFVLFLLPRGPQAEEYAADAIGLGVVSVVGVFVAWLVHRVEVHRAELGARELHFREMIEAVTDYAIYGLDVGGRIVTWNLGAQRLSGYSEAEAVGEHVSLLHTSEERERGHPDEVLREATLHGRFTEEGWRVRKDGTRFWASVLISAIRAPDGSLSGFTKVTRDLTERRRAEEELRDREARLASIVGSAMDAIITTDDERRIVLFNRAAEQMFGVAAEEALGTSIDRFVPAGQMAEVVESGGTARGMHGSRGAFPALRADGTQFPVEATLSTSEVGVQRLFTVVLRDVTKRMRADEERERLLIEMEASSRAKSEFLATMSHELRTPINAIVGYADLMELGIGGDLSPAHADYLRRVRTSSQHLRGLIDDVLDMARVEAGRLEVRAGEEPLVPTVRQAAELVAPQSAMRNVTLSEADVHPIRYRGDPDRVRQVLVNLLGNAVKFTPAGGSISVRSRVCARKPPGTGLGEGPWVGVEVRDTGIGIPADEIERIFEPFTQVDQAYTREQGGTGLGLAISRRLARRMKGDLTARSEPGQGSCFTLWLPAIPAPELVIPPEEPVRWPMRPGEVPGLAELGRMLSERSDEVVRRWAERLARDPAIPDAGGLDRAQLEDHMATTLVELGKELVTLDEGGGEPALLRDGTDIQHLIATRHGEQRARLGWTPVQLRREYDLLRDEVEALLTTVPASADADRSTAHAILQRLLYRAEELSTLELSRTT